MSCNDCNVNLCIRCYAPFHKDANIVDNKSMYHARYDAEKQDMSFFRFLSNL